MTYIKKLVMKGFKSFPRETIIHLDRHMNTIVGPNGAGKCLIGESIVQLADGSLERIDNLVNSRLKNAVKTEDGFIIPGDGTEVLCLDTDSLKIIKKPIKAFVKKVSPDRLLKIKTRSGREVTSTRYHPLFILKNNRVVSARADELNKGVRIAVPRKISFKPEHEYFTELLDLFSLDENIYVPYQEELRILLKSIKNNLTWRQLASKIGISYYVIKGLLDGQAIHITNLIKIMRYSKLSDIEIASKINEIMANGKKTKFSFKNSEEFSRFFGYLLAEGRLTNSSQIWFTNGNREVVKDYIHLVKKLFNKEPLVREYKPNCWDVIVYSELLKKILKKLGMSSKTKDKEISNIILKHSTDKEISNLLNGLYCGDGYISNNSIEITTKSNRLAEGISNCLLRLGIIPYIKDIKKGVRLSGFFEKYKNIVICGVNNLRLFSENINLIHKEKNQRVLNSLNKIANPNTDLIETNSLIKQISKEQEVNVKKLKKAFPRIDAYIYNQCLPSRCGLQLLRRGLLTKDTESTEILDKLINSDIFWDEIIDIKEINKVDWVYDLCVEKDHNFIANNVFVHNSNITDALCFVLGRLSIKSIRAAKAAHLIFSGTKQFKPATLAYVEITLDNTDKTFAFDDNEIVIKRIVKKNGQSTYKINNQTKTRQEVLELLSQAGIDPHGFNIILQGEIERFVKMPAEERRKIIEEIAGISVYEMRKAKSLKELEKTNEKLRQVNAVLRERTNYLKNLENEREQALRYQKLQTTIKRCKASIINKKLQEKNRELKELTENLNSKNKDIEKKDGQIKKIQDEITELNQKIDNISKTIQKSSGFEQDSLLSEITELKQEIAGLIARKENFENQLTELDRRNQTLKESIKTAEQEIREMTRQKGKNIKKELEEKKSQLEELDEIKKKYYLLKSNLLSLNSQIEDKKRQLQTLKSESQLILQQIEQTEKEIKIKEPLESQNQKLIELKQDIEKNKKTLTSLENSLLEKERILAINKQTILEFKKIKSQVSKLDTCPLCKTKITKEHIEHILSHSEQQIKTAEKTIQRIEKQITETKNKIQELKQKNNFQLSEINIREICIIKLQTISEKKQQLKRNSEQLKTIEQESKNLEEKKKAFEKKLSLVKINEEQYETLKLEVNELLRTEERNLGAEITTKQRELDRTKVIIKQIARDKEEISENLKEIEENLEEKQEEVEQKEQQSEVLKKKYNKMFEQKNSLQDKIRSLESSFLSKQNEKRNFENEINNIKISIAEITAKKDTFLQELKEFEGVEFINLPIDKLKQRLENSEIQLERIGSINMRALEVYDGIKEEYDKIREKVEQLEKEKEEILTVIAQIDRKKKKKFLHTLKDINQLFSRNFSQLSTKGIVVLEPQDKKEIFNAGLDIIVKVGVGKRFDVTSLSGGEQTLVALSLIFAIQEYNPYCFYIFDEIDAALDRRNSERLAYLLKKHMKQGQYLIITHNDSIISESTNVLYGVSMQDGVSKVLSLEI